MGAQSPESPTGQEPRPRVRDGAARTFEPPQEPGQDTAVQMDPPTREASEDQPERATLPAWYHGPTAAEWTSALEQAGYTHGPFFESWAYHGYLVHLARRRKRRLPWIRLVCWAALFLGPWLVAYLILNGVPSSNRTPSALLLGLTFALFGVATARLPEALAFSSRDARRALVVDEIHDCLHRLDTGGHGDLSIAYRHLEGRLIAYRPLTATRSARRYYRTHYAAASTMVGDFERDMSMGAQGRPCASRSTRGHQSFQPSTRL
jgi:hypothetical protein